MQQTSMSGVELDEHAITREVLGKRQGHERGAGWRVRGVGASSSPTTASYAPSVSGHSSQPITEAANQMATF